MKKTAHTTTVTVIEGASFAAARTPASPRLAA